jgi:hypothetical protein
LRFCGRQTPKFLTGYRVSITPAAATAPAATTSATRYASKARMQRRRCYGEPSDHGTPLVLASNFFAVLMLAYAVGYDLNQLAGYLDTEAARLMGLPVVLAKNNVLEEQPLRPSQASVVSRARARSRSSSLGWL